MYGPPTRRPRAEKVPLSFVVAVDTVPEGSCLMVTVAPARFEPASLTTLPRIADVVVCAITVPARPAETATAIATRLSFALKFMCVFPFLFKILFYGLAQGVVPIKTIDYFSTARNCYRGSCQIYYSFTFLFNTNCPTLVTLQKIT